MPEFRKKPVVIEAVQWTGSKSDLIAIDKLNRDGVREVYFNEIDQTLSIPTLEGEMIASLNDWIIRGVSGEVYPCKPDIFEKTYDPVEGVQY